MNTRLLAQIITPLSLILLVSSCGKGSAVNLESETESLTNQEGQLTGVLMNPEDSLKAWQQQFGVSNGNAVVSSGGGVSSAVFPSSSAQILPSSSGVRPLSSSTPGLLSSSATGLSSSGGALLSSSVAIPLSSSRPLSSSTIVLPSSSAALLSSSVTVLPSSSAGVLSSSSGGGATTPISLTYGGTPVPFTAGVTYSITVTEARGQIVCTGTGSISATWGGVTKTVTIASWDTAVIPITSTTGTATLAAGGNANCAQNW